jgi:hypothetical protein
MPRPPIEIDFDFHRHEAQRLRRAALDAWLDRLVRALARPWRHAQGPATPTATPAPIPTGDPRCPC